MVDVKESLPLKRTFLTTATRFKLFQSWIFGVELTESQPHSEWNLRPKKKKDINPSGI